MNKFGWTIRLAIVLAACLVGGVFAIVAQGKRSSTNHQFEVAVSSPKLLGNVDYGLAPVVPLNMQFAPAILEGSEEELIEAKTEVAELVITTASLSEATIMGLLL